LFTSASPWFFTSTFLTRDGVAIFRVGVRYSAVRYLLFFRRAYFIFPQTSRRSSSYGGQGRRKIHGNQENLNIVLVINIWHNCDSYMKMSWKIKEGVNNDF